MVDMNELNALVTDVKLYHSLPSKHRKGNS